MHSDETRAPIGIIGGSGFYSLLDEPDERAVDTPWGSPSDALTTGVLAGRDVVFLPRHGRGHRYPPHLVPSRANLWALRAAGAQQVLSLSAVGSLTTALQPGALVVPDQLVDRTWGREHTYFSAAAGVGHAPFADPYCPTMRAAALADGAAADAGALVVVNGPRFSSRAESQEFQRNGWTIIGMTAMPEAALARELGLCYATLGLVTDLDAGVESGDGVTHADVLESFAANLPKLRALLLSTLERLPDAPTGCSCADRPGFPPSFPGA